MTELTWHMPVQLFFGRGCLGKNSTPLKKMGRRAFIVTGAGSADQNGAYWAVKALLDEGGIASVRYNKIEPNPSVEAVRTAATAAGQAGADFVIGIGGGSPLDAAKAVALLAVKEIDDETLFNGPYAHTPLPMVAVPTTAGTGSEVTPFSVLTWEKIKSKRGFGWDALFPKLAYLDPAFSETLPLGPTIHTALDALSHAVEGWLSVRASAAVKPIALASIRLSAECFPTLLNRELPSRAEREKLLYASMLAGIVIAHTGTTAVHAMGYPLTYYHGLDHGRANGLVLGCFLRFLAAQGSDIGPVLAGLGMREVDEFREWIDKLLGPCGTLTDEELSLFSQSTMTSKNVCNTHPAPTEQDVRAMFSASFRR